MRRLGVGDAHEHVCVSASLDVKMRIWASASSIDGGDECLRSRLLVCTGSEASKGVEILHNVHCFAIGSARASNTESSASSDTASSAC